MALYVQKFGGTSVGSLERIEAVAKRIIQSRQAGHEVVVVVSAMAGETNRLIDMASTISDKPEPRELDVLLATGEQVTIALLAMALNRMGQPALSMTGDQVQIRTDGRHGRARISEVQTDAIRAALAKGQVVVIAGFQGRSQENAITTLGRGGSDTTAVAVAAALKADECQIYTDVDGVYTTDPRIEPRARKMDSITFEEMLELSSLGAKVLQIRSVEYAGKYNVPLRVLSSFNEGEGTLITYEGLDMEHPLVSGIAYNLDEARLTVTAVPEKPDMAAALLEPISEAGIEVDMIVQSVADEGRSDFSFTVHRQDYERAKALVQASAKAVGAGAVLGDANIAKVSIVGVGMKSHAGVASKMFRVLGDEGINIQLISTSEIKISVVVDEKYMELCVRSLHQAFALDQVEGGLLEEGKGQPA
ncbi:aspartate kinase [Gallaecimonas sp. GXIMD4217]|uniref:aspartate kinase n=1 Tax=Gallaecimonas sp. GXIMD4217 TaxID=3131927 RepID=UPI00311B0E09